jgi:hypothetical protein
MVPLFYDPDATEQKLSSRYYRDNNIPEVSYKGNLGFDDKENSEMLSRRIQGHCTAKWKDLDTGTSLVEMAP